MTYDLYALEITPGHYTQLFIMLCNDEPPAHLRRIAHNCTLEEIEVQCRQYPQVEIQLSVAGAITLYEL